MKPICFYLLFVVQFIFLSEVEAQIKPCLVREVRSESVQKRRLDTAVQPFFYYTTPEMRPYLAQKEAINCYGFLSYISGGYYIINLIFVVDLANTQQLYGVIPKQSELLVLYLDGKYSKLKTANEVVAKFDEATKTFVYEVKYIVPGSQVKNLKTKAIDKVRITWSTGYESYEIFDVNYLIDLFDCIQSYL